jgi:hypothetical protein
MSDLDGNPVASKQQRKLAHAVQKKIKELKTNDDSLRQLATATASFAIAATLATPVPGQLCNDDPSCQYTNDGTCDDGGRPASDCPPGVDPSLCTMAAFRDCTLGTDCSDCGPRIDHFAPTPPPTPYPTSFGQICSDDFKRRGEPCTQGDSGCYGGPNDGRCDDGGKGVPYPSPSCYSHLLICNFHQGQTHRSVTPNLATTAPTAACAMSSTLHFPPPTTP